MESEVTIDPAVLPIHLHFCHGKIFLWNPDEIIELRIKLGIVGCPVGCYPPKPRQVVQQSLPIQLSNVEAKFVIDHVNSVCVDMECLDISSLTPKQLSRERELQHQIQTHIKSKEKLNLIDSLAPTIKEGKNKKNLKRQLPLENIGSQDEENEVDFDACIEEVKQAELKKCQNFKTNQLWIKMEQRERINTTKPLCAEKMQLTPKQERQYCVYKDLHSKGYFLTDGVKFGGDFLVYPGDPGVYHSMFIAICVSSAKELHAADYSAMGRLASSVKKTLIVCSVDENSLVTYLSIAWSGLAGSVNM